MNRLQSVHVEILRRALGKMVGPRPSRCDKDNSVHPGRVRRGGVKLRMEGGRYDFINAVLLVIYPHIGHHLEKKHTLKSARLDSKLVFVPEPPHQKYPKTNDTLGIQSPSENGFMEPKYLSFRFGDCTPQSSSDKVIGSL